MNHPSRGWRKRALAAADTWVAARVPADKIAVIFQRFEICAALRGAFLDGFSAGRDSTRPPKKD